MKCLKFISYICFMFLLVLQLLPTSVYAAVEIQGTQAIISGPIAGVTYVIDYTDMGIANNFFACAYDDRARHNNRVVTGGPIYNSFPMIVGTNYCATVGLSNVVSGNTSRLVHIITNPYRKITDRCHLPCTGEYDLIKWDDEYTQPTIFSTTPIGGLQSFLYKNVSASNAELQFSGAEVIIDGGSSPVWTGGLV